ncbi:hypothetical protein LUI11_30825 [Bradyrhizobium diazoefficiens]|jgi:hypothetical protein|uniref:Uncharacterized protein n=1 Tax=Bradyrhizobium diazoefficiens TaxID=1355477 RepID=A0A810C726_9BRAD|nr:MULTISPECIES: hypothetical protein [Bradyrhizobium]APO51955.1 hypothetical protein BD122_16820 [Bradyrhizobium diazoefficiens]MCD9294029.1 hypothetical protein [Bradyrhizobium diazoefficiens]MCD9812873.1 hypothetical protein [Bradyrhizobium diazoefficiens]MCD9831220.1 hypothetical protein [Bradyrhizobium diazoefficiens]MCD9851511.1 hypothetical protein [Bradyrhizobium diazoefficiens]
MRQRRRFTQTVPLEERLSEEAKRLRERAKALPHGPQREDLLRKARQAEIGSHMSEWLTSPGLQPPKPA